MRNEEYEIFELITDCKAYLDEEAANEVMHFYKHGEYEMALEGLLIEMMKINEYPENFSRDKIIELAVYYRLNVESVFDHYFWEKFLKWIKAA